MSSQAVNAVGTKFKRWDGVASSPGWVDIAEIKSITGPGMKRATIDVTSLDSIDGYSEFIAGFRDAGEVSLSMNFTRAGYDLMKQDFESDDLQNYEIVLSDSVATSFEFEGLVNELPLTLNIGDAINMEVKIKISSSIVVGSGGNSIP